VSRANMPGSFARDFGERSSVRRACQSLQGQVIRPKTRLCVFSRNARCPQGYARIKYDNHAIVNRPSKSDLVSNCRSARLPLSAQAVDPLAERHQRCDKADAASRNDPKLEEISNFRSETMIFGGCFRIAKFA
jgi:hypothetical protein